MKDMRKEFCSVLKNNAQFLRLKENSKITLNKYKNPQSRHRLKNPVKEGDYGIIPQNRLIILDIDTKKEAPLKQIGWLNKYFNVDLFETLSTVTPSGGFHFYLLLPKDIADYDIPFPKGSLRASAKVIRDCLGVDEKVVIDVDIRSGLSNGYVVGPGSCIDSREYYVSELSKANNFLIKTVDEDFISKLSDLSPAATIKAYERKMKAEAEKEQVSWQVSAVRPPDHVINKVRLGLDRSNIESFHSKRAFVKAALHCCYNTSSIALACSELNVAEDTYSGSMLGWRDLLADIESFTPSGRFHGPYCGKGENTYLNDTHHTAETLRETNEAKIINGEIARSNRKTRTINPIVLDISAIAETLTPKRTGMISQQFLDSIRIMEYFFQPMCNVGAERVLVSVSFASEELNMSVSRVKQALRMLRQANVISVKNRQKAGLAATYTVGSGFEHVFLTKSLRKFWLDSPLLPEILHAPLFYDRFVGGFCEVFGEETYSNYLVKKKSNEMCSVLSDKIETSGPGVLVRYLKEERELIEKLAPKISLEDRE